MMRARNIASALVLLAGVALQGCSGGDHAPKEIAPGAFVLDEPIQVAGKDLKETSKCFVDHINGKRADRRNTWTVNRGEELVLSGWAHGKDGKWVANPMFIRLNGNVQTYYAVTDKRYARPDLESSLKIVPGLASGFELRASIAQVEPGPYAIMVMQPGTERVEGCERPYTLIVN
jgi:hypothetical protein